MLPARAFPARPVLALLALVLVLGACRSAGPVPAPDAHRASSAAPLQQRLVIVVHGDADYLYHTPDGTAHRADAETLREAVAAARSMPRAEVFVVHQRPHGRLLGLFPRDDGTLYHFRRGRLVRRTTYDQRRRAPLAAEAALLRDHRAPTPDSALFTAALYYGHAVPERARPGYHRSRPDVPFGVADLARGLNRLRSSGPFDAVVLSTCDGGTPHTIAALAPHARSVLAAPGDLHLSFIDASLLPAAAGPTDPAAWTRRLAEDAFGRLTGRVTTAVTLATYDVDRTAPTARRLARRVRPDTSTAPAGARHVDCRRALGGPVDPTGVRVWHRPARFGPQADRTTHSGWACRPAD
jgi:hypothetical protein